MVQLVAVPEQIVLGRQVYRLPRHDAEGNVFVVYTSILGGSFVPGQGCTCSFIACTCVIQLMAVPGQIPLGRSVYRIARDHASGTCRCTVYTSIIHRFPGIKLSFKTVVYTIKRCRVSTCIVQPLAVPGQIMMGHTIYRTAHHDASGTAPA